MSSTDRRHAYESIGFASKICCDSYKNLAALYRLHSIFRPPSNPWRIKLIQGQKIDVELPRAGAVRIECDSHGWMLGWVHVVDNPYFAVTDDNGGFEITGIPPGKYTLVATQEDIGPTSIEVEVKAGATVTLPIDLTDMQLG